MYFYRLQRMEAKLDLAISLLLKIISKDDILIDQLNEQQKRILNEVINHSREYDWPD